MLQFLGDCIGSKPQISTAIQLTHLLVKDIRPLSNRNGSLQIVGILSLGLRININRSLKDTPDIHPELLNVSLGKFLADKGRHLLLKQLARLSVELESISHSLLLLLHIARVDDTESLLSTGCHSHTQGILTDDTHTGRHSRVGKSTIVAIDESHVLLNRIVAVDSIHSIGLAKNNQAATPIHGERRLNLDISTKIVCHLKHFGVLNRLIVRRLNRQDLIVVAANDGNIVIRLSITSNHRTNLIHFPIKTRDLHSLTGRHRILNNQTKIVPSSNLVKDRAISISNIMSH